MKLLLIDLPTLICIVYDDHRRVSYRIVFLSTRCNPYYRYLPKYHEHNTITTVSIQVIFFVDFRVQSARRHGLLEKLLGTLHLNIIYEKLLLIYFDLYYCILRAYILTPCNIHFIGFSIYSVHQKKIPLTVNYIDRYSQL